jgi:hypothetical protein
MVFCNRLVSKQAVLITTIYLSFSARGAAFSQAAQAQAGQLPSTQNLQATRLVGTIKSISGNTIIMTTDAGADATAQVQDATKFVRIAPGQKDLKDATSIQLADVQPGDRILVRGKLADDGKSVLALSVVAMTKTDIAEKQSRDREEWQRHGTGGLVSSVDPAGSTISISLPAVGEKKSVAIHLSKNTVLRRYAPDSVKFDDARPAPLELIKPGDQLRARGASSANGSELTADEIVSGTFRNIAGTISAIDASAGTMTVQDLVSKRPVTVRITAESQLRKLPAPVAQRIAMRLKGLPPDAQPSASAPGAAGPAVSAKPAMNPNGPPPGSGSSGRFSGMGRPGGGGTADLQQMMSRMPAAALADLQKGEAVMVVATEGGPNGMPTVITLLGGVEPILQASPNSNPSTILSPWSLNSGGGGEAATP